MRPEQFSSENFCENLWKCNRRPNFNEAGAIPFRKFSSNAFQTSSVISLQRCRRNSAPQIFIQCVPSIFRHFTSTWPEQFRSGNFHPMRFKHLPSFHFNDAGAIPFRKFSSNAFQASSVISLQRGRSNSAPEIVAH